MAEVTETQLPGVGVRYEFTTEAEERALEERLEQTQATRRLTQAQLESIETLITAQRRDIALAEEELAISTSESARARTTPPTSGETTITLDRFL